MVRWARPMKYCSSTVNTQHFMFPYKTSTFSVHSCIAANNFSRNTFAFFSLSPPAHFPFILISRRSRRTPMCSKSILDESFETKMENGGDFPSQTKIMFEWKFCDMQHTAFVNAYKINAAQAVVYSIVMKTIMAQDEAQRRYERILRLEMCHLVTLHILLESSQIMPRFTHCTKEMIEEENWFCVTLTLIWIDRR